MTQPDCHQLSKPLNHGNGLSTRAPLLQIAIEWIGTTCYICSAEVKDPTAFSTAPTKTHKGQDK